MTSAVVPADYIIGVTVYSLIHIYTDRVNGDIEPPSGTGTVRNSLICSIKLPLYSRYLISTYNHRTV